MFGEYRKYYEGCKIDNNFILFCLKSQNTMKNLSTQLHKLYTRMIKAKLKVSLFVHIWWEIQGM